MSSNTPNLGLLKKDPVADGNDTFNIKTMLNDNWDKIDEAVGNIKVPDASLTEKGITQLSSATDSESEEMAATPKAVKAAYDRGSAGVEAAAAAQKKADAAETYAREQDALISNSLESHIDNSVVGENGVHGLRINDENLEYYTGSNWMRIINDNPYPNRVRFHVDNINGNDDNDGLSQTTAFKTIKRAVKEAVKYYKDVAWIHCAQTVTEKIELIGITNLNELYIYGVKYGDSGGQGKPMAKVPDILVRGCTSTIYITSFEISKESSGYTYGMVRSLGNSSVDFGLIRNTVSGGNPAFHIGRTTYSRITSCEISNRGTVIRAEEGSTVYSAANTGTNNDVGLESTYGSLIIKSGTQAGATTATKTSDGGTII